MAGTNRKIFVNLPVRDVARSIAFFEKLGFTFNKQFTDDSAACMVVNEDGFFMLLARSRFKDFARKPIADAAVETQGLYGFSVGSRAEVAEVVKTALAAGATPAAEPQDHGFMCTSSFYDLDGHHWEVLWMDPAALQPQAAA